MIQRNYYLSIYYSLLLLKYILRLLLDYFYNYLYFYLSTVFRYSIQEENSLPAYPSHFESL